MKNRKGEFTWLECVMVVSILLIVAGAAIADLVYSVRVSEENTIHAATEEYSTVRNMYAEQYRTVPAGASGEHSTGTASIFDLPVR